MLSTMQQWHTSLEFDNFVIEKNTLLLKKRLHLGKYTKQFSYQIMFQWLNVAFLRLLDIIHLLFKGGSSWSRMLIVNELPL